MGPLDDKTQERAAARDPTPSTRERSMEKTRLPNVRSTYHSKYPLMPSMMSFLPDVKVDSHGTKLQAYVTRHIKGPGRR